MARFAALILLAFASITSGFVVPSTPSFSSSSSSMTRYAYDASNEVGVLAPTGFWDPMGYTNDDTYDAAKFRRYREIEIKHGRMAQLATMHYFVTYFYRLPGSFESWGMSFKDAPNGLAALKALPTATWAQIVLFCAALEFLAPQKKDRAAGHLQPDSAFFPTLDGFDEEGKVEIQNKELSNGRAAMMAIVGMWMNDILVDTHPIDTLISKLPAH